MAEVVLETPRLLLCEWDDAAWASFTAHTNRPAVMRWLGEVMDADGLAGLRARIDGYNAKFGHTFWAIHRRADSGHLAGEVIGTCGFKRSDREEGPASDMLEIGWRLREDAWGMGYAKEAAHACLVHGFARYDEAQIIALTVVQNTGSWGLMERLGMTRRADWDHHDPRYTDELNPTIVYAVERGDFA